MVEKTGSGGTKAARADVPDFITTRRERGKLAQRAFRQRQIDTIRNLEDENQRLRDAISLISDAEGQDNNALSLAILSARKVAGLPIVQARDPTTPAQADSGLDGSSRSSRASDDDGAAKVSSGWFPDDDGFEYEFVMPSNDEDYVGDWSSLPYPATNLRTYASLTSLEALDSGVDVNSPGLTHIGEITGAPATWFEPDRAIHLVNPPPDIVPYMGEGAYTIAGQMYWAAMAYGFQAIHAVMSSPTPPPAAMDTVMDIFANTLKRVALPHIMYMMRARLSFRRYGYFHPVGGEQYWAVDPGSATEIGPALSAEFLKEGVRKDDFLTPLDIERRLQDQFQDEYPVFEATLRGQAFSEGHVACMRRLMQVMSRQSICFGDGPRWKLESIGALVDGWKSGTRPIAIT
ncbi:hypothetical protein AAE478_008098 [Parahypoxylon ruwenzoriense]